MLAERKIRGRPMSRWPRLSRALRAAMALGLGLAGIAVGFAPADAATDGAPTRLAIAVPLVVPATAKGSIPLEDLETYTQPFGLLSRQLDAIIDRPVAIAIDPMIIASIRLLGTSAPASVTAWLERLEGSTNQTFALTWADSDITLATQAGSGTVLDVETLDFAIDPSLFAPAVDPTATASPTPDPVVPPQPDTKALLAWQYSLTGIAWPRDGTVVSSDLATISASGYSSTIVSSANLELDGPPAGAAEVGSSRVVISDSAVSQALRDSAAAVSDEQFQPAFAALVGAAVTTEANTVLATMGRDALPVGNRLAETLAGLASNPAITLVPFSQAVGDPPVAATIVDSPEPADRVTAATALLEAVSGETRFATIASDPEAITSKRRVELLAVLSSAWAANPAGWSEAVGDFLQQSHDLRASVAVVGSESFNFLADRASLPIAVSNSLDQPVTVYVTVRPNTALLAVENSRVELVIEPNSQAKAQVPVQAVSNGVVTVTVTLSSSTGTPIGDATTAEINVQAGWETPVIVVIAVIVVGVFGVGIVRNILRRRRDSAASDD